MGRERNTTGVGSLLSISSTHVDPRMEASDKVRIALPLPARSHYSAPQLADLSADLREVVTRALETNERSICLFSERHIVAIPVMAEGIFQPARKLSLGKTAANSWLQIRRRGAGLAVAVCAFAREVIDTKDVDALGKIVEVVARHR